MTTQKDIEIWKEEAHEKGLAEGEAKGKLEVARAMLARGMDISLVSELTDITVGQLQPLSTSR